MKRIILFSLLIFSFTSFTASQERLEQLSTNIGKDSLPSHDDSCTYKKEIEETLKHYLQTDSLKPGHKDGPQQQYPPIHPKRMTPEYRKEFYPRLIYCSL